MTIVRKPKRLTQTFVGVAEVVETTDQKHASGQGVNPAGGTASATSQIGQSLPKSAIESFDISRVDHALELSFLQQPFNCNLLSLDNATLNIQGIGLAILHHLHDVDIRPGDQSRSTPFPSTWQSGAKSPMDSTGIGGEAIHCEENRQTQGHHPHNGEKLVNHSSVSGLTDNTAEPETTLDRHGHSHPNRAALHFDLDFIGLDLTQIQLLLLDDFFMYGLAVFTRQSFPLLDRSFVESKNCHDCRDRTSIGQQTYDLDHDVWVCVQTIE
jgi:hypothetical protein